MPDPVLIRVHRHRLRKAGKLPPVPICPPGDVLVEATGQMSSLDGQGKPLVKIIPR